MLSSAGDARFMLCNYQTKEKHGEQRPNRYCNHSGFGSGRAAWKYAPMLMHRIARPPKCQGRESGNVTCIVVLTHVRLPQESPSHGRVWLSKSGE